MTRATTGGEYGMNGEFYAGGQFLPNTELPKRGGKINPRATRKQEIAPYVWEVAPNGEQSIYTIITGSWAKWKEFGKVLEPYHPYIKVMQHKGVDCQPYLIMIDRWNAGDRWL